MQTAQGFVQLGGQTVYTGGVPSTTSVMRSFVAATVSVFNAGTATLTWNRRLTLSLLQREAEQQLGLVQSSPNDTQQEDNPDGIPSSVFDEIVDGLSKDKPAYLTASAPGFFGGPNAVTSELMTWGVALATRASLRRCGALRFPTGTSRRRGPPSR